MYIIEVLMYADWFVSAWERNVYIVDFGAVTVWL